jgi:hypothetical protein
MAAGVCHKLPALLLLQLLQHCSMCYCQACSTTQAVHCTALHQQDILLLQGHLRPDNLRPAALMLLLGRLLRAKQPLWLQRTADAALQVLRHPAAAGFP